MNTSPSSNSIQSIPEDTLFDSLNQVAYLGDTPTTWPRLTPSLPQGSESAGIPYRPQPSESSTTLGTWVESWRSVRIKVNDVVMENLPFNISGHFGDVYRARHLRYGLLALKRLRVCSDEIDEDDVRVDWLFISVCKNKSAHALPPPEVCSRRRDLGGIEPPKYPSFPRSGPSRPVLLSHLPFCVARDRYRVSQAKSKCKSLQIREFVVYRQTHTLP